MKKAMTLLPAAVMALFLAACSGNDSNTTTPGGDSTPTAATTQEETTTPSETVIETAIETNHSNWIMSNAVDDFGDDTGIRQIVGSFAGDFSNTATGGSQLDVQVIYQLLPNGDGVFGFRLFEYGNTKATFTTSQANHITLRTRALGTDNTYALFGQAPNSDLMFAIGNLTNQPILQNLDNAFLEWMNTGEEISCIIDIGSARYNFMIDTNGFLEEYNELQELYQAALDKKLAESYLAQGTITGSVYRDGSELTPTNARFVKVIESDIDILEEGMNLSVIFDEDTLAETEINIGDTITFTGSVHEQEFTVIFDGYRISLDFDVMCETLLEGGSEVEKAFGTITGEINYIGQPGTERDWVLIYVSDSDIMDMIQENQTNSYGIVVVATYFDEVTLSSLNKGDTITLSGQVYVKHLGSSNSGIELVMVNPEIIK